MKCCGPCALCLCSRAQPGQSGCSCVCEPVSPQMGAWAEGLFTLQGACCEAQSVPSWPLRSLDQVNSVAWLFPYLRSGLPAG